MSIERKRLLVWLAIMIAVALTTEVLWQTHPELFREDEGGSDLDVVQPLAGLGGR